MKTRVSRRREEVEFKLVSGKGVRDVKNSLRRWARHRMARLHHRVVSKV